MLRVFRGLGVKNWLMMLVCTVFIVLQVWLDLRLPDYMSDITRLVETDGSKIHDVLVAGGKMLGVSAGSMGCAIVSSLVAAVIAARVSKDLRARQFYRVESYGPEEIDKFSTPSLVTRATNDVTQVQMFLTLGLVLIVRAPVMAVWAICKIAGKGVEWTEATALALGLLLLMVGVLLVTCLPKFKSMQTLTDEVNRVAREGLTGIRTIRAYNAEGYQQKRFDEVNSDLTKTQLFTSRATASIMPFMTLVLNGLSLAIYWIGAFLIGKPKADVSCTMPKIPNQYMPAMADPNVAQSLIMSGKIQPDLLSDYGGKMEAYKQCMSNGADALKTAMESRIDVFSNMVVFSSYAMQVIMAFLLCAMLFVLLPRAQASAKRIWEVIDTHPSIVDPNPDDAIAYVASAGDADTAIEFNDVSYVYPENSAPSLRKISFVVEKGETLGIIGSTGSGKSTLADLIPRLREVSSGHVIIDGKNVKEWGQHELRSKIGYATQKAIMLKGTIRDNIRLGVTVDENNEEANRLDRWAAGIAQASEFIDSHEEGMDYLVSQGGSNLSGGQKQRLNIARAVRLKPEILILDDSTSALDMKTDAALRMAIHDELKGTTIVMIAQRVSSIMHADKILVLDDGKTVGLGTHEELLESCPQYRETAEAQLGSEVLNDGRD